ncbi:hypothetical protein BD626DRAFT_258359 [Schizophyllum amplum]|uniref:Uncharacterized protein n=1 Tax=Schizophyllum amplum TaxID=97359 RepID=A0A550BUQ4_9AGAR|nr:hypothetical protein BD626DRAFT_258359 [Auriculariopsis ampla]
MILYEADTVYDTMTPCTMCIVVSHASSWWERVRRVCGRVGGRASCTFVCERASCMLVGERASCTLVGGRVSCTLVGGRASCTLVGGRASCTLVGGRASCTLVGGRASCTLVGGRASCTLVDFERRLCSWASPVRLGVSSSWARARRSCPGEVRREAVARGGGRLVGSGASVLSW